MARAFVGPRAKVRRAQRKIETLKRQFDAFISANSYGVYSEFDPKTGDHILRAYARSRVEEPPLIRWSIIVGEIAYNFRSALDQAVCELATARNAPCDRTSFPIFPFGPRAKRHHDASGRSLNFNWESPAIRPLAPRHRRIIESVQPYHRTDADRIASPVGKRRRFFCLWLLHEMNNADKHRSLLELHPSPMESAVTVRSVTMETDWLLDYAAPVYDDAPIGWLRSPTPEQVDVDGYLALQIAFSDGDSMFRTWNVIQVLEWISRTVVDVLDDLELGRPRRTLPGSHSVPAWVWE